MPIRTLIFDLGKVIVDFSFDQSDTRLEALSGLTPGEVRARLLRDDLVTNFETGRIGSPAFVDEVNRRLGTSLELDAFAELWTSIFHLTPLIPESLFAQLRTAHRLVLLSNTNPLHFEMVRANYPHIAHFDALVLSHEVGALKPHPPIYHVAIEQARCEPHECLFFDDLAENVQGARAAGLHAEQFVGLDQLQLDLARYGVRLA